MSLKEEDLGGRGRLASGGMGSLYVVRHQDLGALRVAKELRRDRASKAEFMARFNAEAKATAKLRHHNIVEILDFFPPDPAAGKPGGILMELIRGVNLKRLIAEMAMDDEQKKRVALFRYGASRDLVADPLAPGGDSTPEDLCDVATWADRNACGFYDS